jgi:hypothetical protein
MDQNRILAMGVVLQGSRASKFLDAPNFNEFDAIIWYPEPVLSDLSANQYTQPMVSGFLGKISQLVEWVSRGHCLVVVTCPLQSFWYVAGNVQKQCTFEKDEPFSGISFEQSAGQNIEFCGPSPIQPLIRPTLPTLYYNVILKFKDMIPLLKVAKGRFGTDQYVGVIKKLGKGFVIFTPPQKNVAVELSRTHYRNVVTIPDYLIASPEALPDWTQEYQIDVEKSALDRISTLRSEIAELDGQVLEQQQVLQSVQSLKQLFVGTGDSFVDCVAHALTELGLKVVQGPRGRADLIGYDGKQVATFEIKGLEGSARESNLRQTERWVADIKFTLTANADEITGDSDLVAYAAKIHELEISKGADLNCKGIMIIGTFRTTPLAERQEPDFPDPVARAISRSTVCALTGLQLLGLLLGVRQGRYSKSEVLETLFSTNGVLQCSRDWPSFLFRTDVRQQ